MMLSKQVSFIVDNRGNRQAAVVPIDIYDELMALQKALQESRPGERELYHFHVKGAVASGYPVGQRHQPGFMLLAGSTLVAEQADSLREAVIELRLSLQAKGLLVTEAPGYRLTEDYLFNSPSLAASLVAGNNRSGLDAWRNDAGFSLKASGFGKKE
ncbi:DUF4357 domain-containing protein [Pseudaeromonas paramecii]|uniref:DUF4357 domain-containing protein n=2 Tax=Pseudaeromonas paramecii TaxID=2138166 RepID=A0ABP8Q7H5_9GAMM